MSRMRCLAFACAVLIPFAAQAEKADRSKPVNIDADRMTVDEKNKVRIFEGNVVLTQGTLVLRCARLLVTEDAGGFQRGVASGGPNGLAHIRQKREGADEYVEGEGERIEHDSKLEQSELFNRAWVRSGKDEVRGEYIFIDGKTENYMASSGRNGAIDSSRGGRVRAILQPKKGGQPATSVPEAPPVQVPASSR